MMEAVIKLTLDTALIYLVMGLLEKDISGKNLKRLAGAFCVVIVAALLMKMLPEGEPFIQESINLLSTFFILLLLTKLSVKKFVVLYGIALLFAGILEEAAYIIVHENTFYIKIALIGCVYLFKKVYWKLPDRRLAFRGIPGKLILTLAVLLFFVLLLLVGISVNYDSESRVYGYISVLTLAAIIAACIVGIEGIKLGISRLTLQKENEMLQRYNLQQKHYYELFLKSEEDTRRFRHDLLNHMQCIYGLLQEGKEEECKKYVQDITNDLHDIGKVYCTGNRIADIVLTSSLAKLEKKADIQVLGKMKEDTGISDYDFCAVLSNMVDNAVEAVNIQDTDAPYIKILFTTGRRFMKIEVTNSLSREQIEFAKELRSNKDDEKMHGLGLKNVALVVGKYGGQMKYTVTEDAFYIYVQIDMNALTT